MKSMLEYAKRILSKVSFDIKLFKKELKKSFTYLERMEMRLLIRWCYKTFTGIKFKLSLDRSFATIFRGRFGYMLGAR